MKVATGLATGPKPIAELAHEAVSSALTQAGLTRADQVILFLSRDFARNPQPALLAAARTAGCLSVSGSTANGIFTEKSAQSDQSAAGAMIFTGSAAELPTDHPLISFSTHGRLPVGWQNDHLRAGFLDSDGEAWSHGRIAEHGCVEIQLPAARVECITSTGQRTLGSAQLVGACRGYELQKLGGHTAIDSLRRALPPELRERPPLHQISLLRHPDAPGVAILSANADGSLMLADALAQEESVIWAIRQPLTAEQQIRNAFDDCRQRQTSPSFALMFSCIGRGPLFYGDEDRDRQAFCTSFPETPLLGAYGTGQIIPWAGSNQLYHNAVLTLLYESSHV